MNLTRRQVLGAAAGGFTLTRCAKSPQPQKTVARPVYKSAVTIAKAPAYTHDIYDTVYRMVAGHGLSVRGKRIVLKPNLVEFDPHTAINTNPMVVHAAYE